MLNEHTFSLLTKHGKEKVIAPLLQQKLGIEVNHTEAFDTDQLGTFSGEIERVSSPLTCAIKKAILAFKLTGDSVGLGSEGSFFISPAGIGTVNEELLACVKDEAGGLVIGRYLAPVDVRQAECESREEIINFVQQTPANQGLVLKSNGHLAKGLQGEEAVLATVQAWFGRSSFERTTISFDLRAHQCPVRRQHIAGATENLVERLQSPCPECDHPGFWPDRPLPGLPCELCAAPTRVSRAQLAECAKCAHAQSFPVEQETAEARYCDFCNP